MTIVSVRRILVVDDNESIHADFHKVLDAAENVKYNAAMQAIFGQEKNQSSSLSFPIKIDSAYQGQEAVAMVKQAIVDKNSYALAFVDIRMPPGWDGIDTILHLWEVDPDLQIVICTAYSDYSWGETVRRLQRSDNFLILKKPFDSIEIRQIVAALIKKWDLKKAVDAQIANLNYLVEERTSDLAATLESTVEGILACDSSNKIIAYNQNFLEFSQLDEQIINSQPGEFVFQTIANQFDESQLFLKTISNLNTSNDQENKHEWKLKNGKIIELYIHPRLIQQKNNGHVFSFRDITEQKLLEAKLLYQSTHDSLTGLPNRLLLIDRIQQAIIAAKRKDSLIAVILLDLDNFKQVNDSLGHHAGDTLLKIVAQNLNSCVRSLDTVTRLGGDEFVIVLTEIKREDELLDRINYIRNKLTKPIEINNHQFTITASMGVSIYAKHGHDAETLIKNADAAMYNAKQNGSNLYQFYQLEFNNHLLQQAELTSELYVALEKNQFIIYYQPLLNITSGKVMGVEALLRWNHPSLGMIMPNDFIFIAEENGLIVPIGTWVLNTACKQVVVWQKTISENLHIAVNVSSYQFRQADFTAIVHQALQTSGLRPGTLEIEITESLLLGNTTEVSNKMLELKKMGVNFSMDDFGTGYASLNYLKCFPFDKVKIDKSFIAGVTFNKEDNTIVEAIINMTKSMGVEVIAEGVEKLEQIEFLRSKNSDQIQGFYVSPAVDVERCDKLLRELAAHTKL